MNDLTRACDHLDIGEEQVVKHRYEGITLVLLVNYGIGGVKKYRIPLAELEPEPEPEPEPEQYTCGGCGRSFDSERGLSIHQRYCDALDEPDEEE